MAHGPDDGSNNPLVGADESAFKLADFDRYIAEHGIPQRHYPAAFALWIAEQTGGPVPRYEKVEREPTADGVVIEGDAL
jgi:hypothetical protein